MENDDGGGHGKQLEPASPEPSSHEKPEMELAGTRAQAPMAAPGATARESRRSGVEEARSGPRGQDPPR